MIGRPSVNSAYGKERAGAANSNLICIVFCWGARGSLILQILCRKRIAYELQLIQCDSSINSPDDAAAIAHLGEGRHAAREDAAAQRDRPRPPLVVTLVVTLGVTLGVNLLQRGRPGSPQYLGRVAPEAGRGHFKRGAFT